MGTALWRAGRFGLMATCMSLAAACGLSSAAPTPLQVSLGNEPPAATPRLAVVTPAVTPPSRPPSSPAPLGKPPTHPVSGSTWTAPADQMTLVYIPAGQFWMGSQASDPYAEPDELPARRVRLDGYWIDLTEVTNAMYARCAQAGACQPPPATFSDFSPHAYYGTAAYAAYPVVNVSWDQARDYCAWAGRRLPTEAEWERAARGDAGRRYPWEWSGAPDPQHLNFCDRRCTFEWNDRSVDDGYAETAPVGSYPRGASPFGVLDMAGNVWQWVADWYAAGYYDQAPSQNPVGPSSGSLRVLRGSSWLDGVYGEVLIHARSANRYALDPNTARSDIGFRCAMTPVQ